MNILVTGGLGFIGYPIVKSATANADVNQVVSLGRSPVKPGTDLPPNKVVHHAIDIANQSQVEAVLKKYQITHVIHAAGLRTSASEQAPSAAVTVNINGTQSVVNAAKCVASVESFSLLSTSAIYGKISKPIDESQPISPSNPYCISKAAAELLLADSTLPFRSLIIRPAFVIGKPALNGPIQGVIQNLLHDAKQGKSSVWKFADHFFLHYCPDLAQAILNLASHQQASGTFHLPGHPVQLETLTQAVTELCKGVDHLPIDPQTELPLPSELLFEKYKNLFPDDAPTPLKIMLTEVLNSMDTRFSHLDQSITLP